MATINGNNNANTLTGTNGIDTLFGLGGNDTLRGLSGNDRLDGGTGNDRMEGGKGNDVYVVDSASDVVVEALNQGTDTILSRISLSLPAHVERLTLLGNTNLNVTGNALNNLIIGNSGANALNGGGGHDVMFGGAGNDTLTGGPANDTIDGGTGADTMAGGTGADIYVINDAGDRATDADANSIVRFAPAQDGQGLVGDGAELAGAAVFSVMQGDEFSNTLSARNQNGRVTLLGGDGDDALEGGDGNDLILGEDGDDRINGLLGTNVTGLEGGNGNDTIDGGRGNDVLNGESGDDSLIGGEGNDVLTGESGDDSLLGGAGADILNGNDNNDRLDGGAGVDLMTGGFGDDTFVVDNVFDSPSENAGQGVDRVLAWVSFALNDVDIENLILANEGGNISGNGNGVANTIIGSLGHNILQGLGGDDTLQGRDGNDTLDGGVGADRMEGGLGVDTFMVDNAGDVVVELNGEGLDSVFSSLSFTLPNFVENLTLLSTASNFGTGNASNNVITGNVGTNIINGLAGNDRLIGGEGNDTLVGGVGNDRLIADLGDDRVTGGNGIDIMTGGLGADVFRYDALSDGVIRAVNGVLPAGAAIDRVTDFFGLTAGNGFEVFEFAQAAFAGGVLGNGPTAEGTSFSTIGAAFSGTNAGANANHDAALPTFVFSTADRVLYYDNNGDAAGYTAIAKLDTGTLSAGDVIINP